MEFDPVEPVSVPRRAIQRSHLPILLGVLAGLTFLLIIPYVAEQVTYSITRGRARAEAEVARAELAALPEAVNRFRLAAKAIEPSVVGIEVIRLVGTQDDEWASLFWPRPRVGMNQGSGVIVDKEGYIVTNAHVVNGANQITVRLSDGQTIREVEAVGMDSASDLAVLRIRVPGLVAAAWGDSEQLEVGDQVLAIGNPYQLAQTVTAGIISAKDRRGILRNLDLQDFLQTDAAINPGNSGGPLVNLRGEVIGINTAIVGEAYRGIGFAIPSKLAQEVYNKLKAGERMPRGWLGVVPGVLDERLAEQLKLQDARGVLVEGVAAGSPAEKAGIEPGDVIVEWNGKRVNDPNDLRFLAAGSRVGSSVKVGFYRDGEKKETTVTITERPSRMGRP
jgi:serine protease Do